MPEHVLIGANEKAEADLFVDSVAPALTFSDTSGSQRAALGAASDGPWFSLNDASGFKTDIGVTHLVSPETGEERRTAAASIALFGKDKNVLWSAPPTKLECILRCKSHEPHTRHTRRKRALELIYFHTPWNGRGGIPFQAP